MGFYAPLEVKAQIQELVLSYHGSGLCCKFFNPLNSFLIHDTALKQYNNIESGGKISLLLMLNILVTFCQLSL